MKILIEGKDKTGFDSNEEEHSKVVAATEESPLLGNNSDQKKKGRFTKNLLLVMIVVSLGNFLAGACTSLQGPFFPREAELKGATPSQYGLVFAVYQLSVFVSAPVYAKLLRFISPTFMTNAAIFLLGGSSALFGLLNMAPSGQPFIALAYAVRIFEGLASAAFSTGSFAIVATEFPDKVATVYSTVSTFLGVGLIAGPTLGGLMYEVGGYTLPFEVVGGLLILLCIVGVFALPKTIGSSDKLQSGNLKKFWFHTSTIIHAIAITSWTVYLGYNSAILEPFLRQFSLTPVMVGLVFIISGGIYALANPFVGWMCDKMKMPDILCTLGCFLCCVYLLLIGPAPFLPLKTELWLVITSLVIFGLGIAGIFMPAMMTVMRDALERGFPNDLTTYGMVSSLVSASMAVGFSAGPSIGGYLEESVGFRNGTLVLFGVSLGVELHVGNNNLIDISERLLTNLVAIRVLDLRDNKISVLPESMSHLQGLERLDITNNDIAILPYSLGNLIHLKSLSIDGNLLKNVRRDIVQRGTVQLLKWLKGRMEENSPARPISGNYAHRESDLVEMFNKHSLSASRTLDLSNKGMTHLPQKLLTMAEEAEVSVVDLSKNSLVSVPQSLEPICTQMTELKVGFNKLTSLPGFLGMCPHLSYLDFRNNQLSDLPKEISSLVMLREINMTCNRFEHLPEVLYTLKKLEIILAADNKIQDINVEGLSKLTLLAALDLSNNDIVNVPPELGTLTQLRSLQLEGNPSRNPRISILAKGTQAVMEYLRGRMPQT